MDRGEIALRHVLARVLDARVAAAVDVVTVAHYGSKISIDGQRRMSFSLATLGIPGPTVVRGSMVACWGYVFACRSGSGG